MAFPDSESLWDADRTAAYLGIPPRSLYTQRVSGRYPGALGIIIGRHLRFDPADVREWIESLKNETKAAANG